ncbi:MAG: UDP-N-acetylmuramoyl-tripeptide--D-alanyl-D-alanine ligase [Candidatus Sungbacteria bacterium]|nr:UDP-N-acetylmuramoyl-tripeptide--D-alanyl-D-alanine ligase [Candidatus Sungbacteria bacterium]
MKKSILQEILALLARATIWKYKPIVIGITGSTGKTSTREAIACVVGKKYRVRQPEKNFNNEIGLPLTVLGMQNYGRNIFAWLIAFLRVMSRILIHGEYPEVLVLEYGIDTPGDMDRLLAIAHPSVGVVTTIGEVPVHVEFFENPEEIAKEKEKLVAVLDASGYAILNADDPRVSVMEKSTKAKVSRFGFQESADVRIVNADFVYTRTDSGEEIPKGMSFRIEYGGSMMPVRLHGALGKPQIIAAAGAMATGLAMGMNLVEISEALQMYAPQPGRMRLVKGINNSLILDDTYNAAPESTKAALETLQALSGKRKVAILGTMAELGKFNEQTHRAIGRQAAEFVDVLIGVGLQAQLILDEVKKSHHGREVSRFFYDDSRAAAEAVPSLMQKGDLILVKGSQSMRMERIVEAVMQDPEDAEQILVRQGKEWQSSK